MIDETQVQMRYPEPDTRVKVRGPVQEIRREDGTVTRRQLHIFTRRAMRPALAAELRAQLRTRTETAEAVSLEGAEAS